MELNRRPNPQDPPVLYCRCGAGVCSILRSPRNRLFYLCPAILPREDCGFFKWCDEVSAPIYRCGAGRCSIRTHPFAGRQYFACPMEEGYHSWGFSWWVADQRCPSFEELLISWSWTFFEMLANTYPVHVHRPNTIEPENDSSGPESGIEEVEP